MGSRTAAIATAVLTALMGVPGTVELAHPNLVSTFGVVAEGHAPSRVGSVASRRLVIPKLDVDAGIIPVGITEAGQLAVGTSVRSVYRWRYGVAAGQPGSAVLAGHTWSRGAGVFDRLGQLRPGDRVSVGRARFRVTRVRRVTTMSAAEVQGLFSDRGRPRLVLITCGNRNNVTGEYRTRIIVNAEMV